MDDQEYATHLPVLKALAKILPLSKVLEFGSGRYSTGFFLSLPLKELVSVEADNQWRSVNWDDPRHTLTEEAPPVDAFDLVFIDDGEEQRDRERTIKSVLTQDYPVTVIHDAEVYAPYIRDMTQPHNVLLVALQEPHTAIVWPDGESRSHDLLKAMEATCEFS